MAKPPFKVVDYDREALERVTEQFKEADIFQRYLFTLIDGYDDIAQCFQDLMQMRSISTAEGAQLDIIGEIVGQPRELVEADLFSYFGFQGALNAASFGEIGRTVGGMFYNLGDNLGGNIALNDEQYRMFIRAKIFKNSFTSTPEEFITAVNQIFQTNSTFISVDEKGYAVVFFGRELTAFERVLINYTFTGGDYPVRLLPKTIGVRLEFGTFREGEYFGFQGAPGAKGFGGLGRSVGGYGADYGQAYGRRVGDQGVECVSTAFLDGEFNLNGTVVLDGQEQCYPTDGGWFAELTDVAA